MEANSTDAHEPTITIGGQTYRKFIPYPAPVDDDTLRCIACGQIDEPEYHDPKLCPCCQEFSPDALADELHGVRHDD